MDSYHWEKCLADFEQVCKVIFWMLILIEPKTFYIDPPFVTHNDAKRYSPGRYLLFYIWEDIRVGLFLRGTGE